MVIAPAENMKYTFISLLPGPLCSGVIHILKDRLQKNNS